LPLHHGQLLPEGEILESEFLDTRRANEKTKDQNEEPKHVNEYQVALEHGLIAGSS
jgi:hypothetical protein